MQAKGVIINIECVGFYFEELEYILVLSSDKSVICVGFIIKVCLLISPWQGESFLYELKQEILQYLFIVYSELTGILADECDFGYFR